MTTEYIDHPPADWHVLDVMRKRSRAWDWCAAMIDVDPDDFRERRCGPYQFRYVTIPGKHRNYEAAWDALEAMLATRH